MQRQKHHLDSHTSGPFFFYMIVTVVLVVYTTGQASGRVEESYPTPHIHEQMTTSNYGYDTAYNFTHNNIMLEPNAMNNIDTVAHMNVHNTQY